MMLERIKAFFVDFYGTVVEEDGDVVEEISRRIFETGKAESPSQVDGFWWKEFQNLCLNSHGANFQTQRALEEESLRKTLIQFGSSLDAKELGELMFAHWVKPPIFLDAKSFFEKSPIPIYVVSNIDTADVMQALKYHGLTPAGVFTSEDARSYKPRKELFELALRSTGLRPEEGIHIGDSMSSDVRGAEALGIKALWLNRFGKAVPEDVDSIVTLLDALDRIC